MPHCRFTRILAQSVRILAVVLILGTLQTANAAPLLGQPASGLSPRGETLNVAGDIALTWNPAPGASHYLVTIVDATAADYRNQADAPCGDGAVVCTRTTSSSLLPIRVVPGRTYEWRVTPIAATSVSGPETSALFSVAPSALSLVNSPLPSPQLPDGMLRADVVSSADVEVGESYRLKIRRAVGGTLVPYAGAVDARYRICGIQQPSQCSESVTVTQWNTTDSSGLVTVPVSQLLTPGVYRMSFRYAGMASAWGNEIAITVRPALGGRATVHHFRHLRAGVQATADGWRAEDFAFHFVNPSHQAVDIRWTMISDDPNFVFKDGSVGTLVSVLPTPPWGYQSLNVHGPEAYPFILKPHTYFTGRAEVRACVAGSSPCIPASIYAYKLSQIPRLTGADPDLTWFQAWDKWRDQVPVTWDAELGSFLVPYTNYWHNVGNFPGGWHSRVTITNHSAVPVTYTFRHVPDSYSRRSAPQGMCALEPFVAETATLSVGARTSRSVSLESLFGWRPDVTSFMEGYLTISADTYLGSYFSTITSEVTPGAASSTVCPVYDFNLGRLSFVGLQQSVTGVTALQARVAVDRGVSPDSVVFFIDGQPIGNGTLSERLAFDSVLTWNPAGVSPGSHTLSARAYRGGVQIGNTAEQTVIVSPAPLSVSVLQGSWTSPGGSYTLRALTHATGAAPAPFSGAVDARYRVCQLVNPSACTPASVAPSWAHTLSDGSVRINVPSTLSPGYYRASLRPAGAALTEWSNEIVITVASFSIPGTSALKQKGSGGKAGKQSLKLAVSARAQRSSGKLQLRATVKSKRPFNEFRIYTNGEPVCAATDSRFTCSWSAQAKQAKRYRLVAFAIDSETGALLHSGQVSVRSR